MNNRSLKALIFAGTAAVACSSVAIANGSPGKSCNNKKPPMVRMMNHLSDQEKTEVKQIIQSSREKADPIRQKLRAKRAMLDALLLQQPVNTKRVEPLVTQVAQLESQLLQLKVDMRIELAKQANVHVRLDQPRHHRPGPRR